MRSWLQKYFGFSHSELNGITVLVVLLALLWFGAPLYRRWFSDKHLISVADIREIERFLAAPVVKDAALPDTAVLFLFDPNGLSAADWKRLGLADRQVRMIKNYEAKGGRFRTKEDLAKIYALSAADYSRLEPYIRINENRPVNQPTGGMLSRRQGAGLPVVAGRSHGAAGSQWPKTSKTAMRIELNTADSLLLQELPGIGPVYASRIVRFRDLLGGFYDTRQLLQVYGMDTARYDGLKALVYADTAEVRKIELNTADYDRLRRHPYIGARLARLILQYKNQHGPYRRPTDLLGIAVMDEEIFRKIVPYLNITDD